MSIKRIADFTFWGLVTVMIAASVLVHTPALSTASMAVMKIGSVILTMFAVGLLVDMRNE